MKIQFTDQLFKCDFFTSSFRMKMLNIELICSNIYTINGVFAYGAFFFPIIYFRHQNKFKCQPIARGSSAINHDTA